MTVEDPHCQPLLKSADQTGRVVPSQGNKCVGFVVGDRGYNLNDLSSCSVDSISILSGAHSLSEPYPCHLPDRASTHCFHKKVHLYLSKTYRPFEASVISL